MSWARHRGSFLRILVVEDSSDLQLLYSKLLTLWGHKVEMADSLNVALTSLRDRGLPDAIILDLTLPDANSEMICDAFLNYPEIQKSALVVTSGRDDLKDWGQKIGARKAFHKPVDSRQLKEFLDQLRPAAPAPQPETSH